MVEPLSPFANKEMTTEERIKYKAERDFNLECERNGGELSLSALQSFSDSMPMVRGFPERILADSYEKFIRVLYQDI